MAVSYVLVTVAAVVLVEGVVLGILLPPILARSSRDSQTASVAAKVGSGAKLVSAIAATVGAGAPRTTTPEQLVNLLAHSTQIRQLVSLATRRGHVNGGQVPGPGRQCWSTAGVEALISVNGTVLASSSPELCPVGARLGFAALAGRAGQGTRATAHGGIFWAVSPVVYALMSKVGAVPIPTPTPSSAPSPSAQSAMASPSPGTGSGEKLSSSALPLVPQGTVLGALYAAVPERPSGVTFAQVRPLLIAGGVILALVIPVGTVFGLLSTRRVIRRIKRLAEVTGTVAGGDFQPRVPVSGGDEIGRLEDAFNRMTGRLSAAVDAERVRAGTDARQAERARIARELHDSISQDLFSLSLLAAGLRRALHADPALRPEVTAMERTSARAMREMQALLLELRPVALEDAGLVPAVTELCQAYQERLAIKVTAELGEVSLGPAGEHAVLRIVQEALGNAARHGAPETILVRMSQRDGFVTVEVRDDGRGFDPGGVAERHGMGLTLMRERVTELGGDFQLDATPGEGAAIVVRLPAGQDGRP
jgi:signal transduction histidine kinase